MVVKKEDLSETGLCPFSGEDLGSSDFNTIEIERDQLFIKQSGAYDGLKIILEGQCHVSCDPDQIRAIHPHLMVDHRNPVVNYTCLKERLNKLIIPSLKDHNFHMLCQPNDQVRYKAKYIRTLIKGDTIGDFEYLLKMESNLLAITNSSSTLKLAHVPLQSIPKLVKRNPKFLQNMLSVAFLKCKRYQREERLTVLFDNIQTTLKSLRQKPSEYHRSKSAMSDFEATLKLYSQNTSALIPSFVPNSMSMMWKMKQAEDYWKTKIENRKFIQESENQIKINYFRSFHHQSARSTKSLEGLKVAEKNEIVNNQENELNKSEMFSPDNDKKNPSNNLPGANIWTVMKAVNRFKHNPYKMLQTNIAMSKTKILKAQKRLSVNLVTDKTDSGHDGGDELDKGEQDERTKRVDFDRETSDANLRSIELRMKTFFNSLPHGPTTNRVVPLKRYSVNSKSIPILGSTVLVRLKLCNPLEEHQHIQHHILPKDTLSTLQKYRASKLKPNE